MLTFFKVLSILPLRLLHGLGWAMGWLVFAASGTYRRRFLANAHLAGVKPSAWRGAVGEAGKLVAELPRLWLGRTPTTQWTGEQHVQAALDQERGVLFLTPHMGCFEIAAQAYAQRFGAQQPMTVLFRPARKKVLAEVVSGARARQYLQTAPTTLGGVKQLLKALKSGQAVALLPDQVPPAGQGQWAPFFGQEAYTMTLSVRLARQPNTTVLIARCERLTRARGYILHISALPFELSGDMDQALVQINQAMEQQILQCPQQYLWGYARYKQPREVL